MRDNVPITSEPGRHSWAQVLGLVGTVRRLAFVRNCHRLRHWAESGTYTAITTKAADLQMNKTEPSGELRHRPDGPSAPTNGGCRHRGANIPPPTPAQGPNMAELLTLEV